MAKKKIIPIGAFRTKKKVILPIIMEGKTMEMSNSSATVQKQFKKNKGTSRKKG